MIFRVLEPGVHVAGQIRIHDLDEAVALGIRYVVSNRPDEEEPGQTAAAEMAIEASTRGLVFLHAPVRGMPGPDAIEAVQVVLATGEPVLLFCKSGMRSAAAWGMAAIRSGRLSRARVVQAAAAAGYDLAMLAPG